MGDVSIEPILQDPFRAKNSGRGGSLFSKIHVKTLCIERGVIPGFNQFPFPHSASFDYAISARVGHRVVTGVTVTPQLDL